VKKSLILLLLTLTLSASTFDKAQEAYENEDYKKAAALMKPLAESGHMKAQTCLAVMYEDGDGVPQDANKALHWYKKAAIQGDVDSQLILAMSYCHGDGVGKNLKTCAKWAKMAKDQGENVAILWSEFNLGKY